MIDGRRIRVGESSIPCHFAKDFCPAIHLHRDRVENIGKSFLCERGAGNWHTKAKGSYGLFLILVRDSRNREIAPDVQYILKGPQVIKTI